MHFERMLHGIDSPSLFYVKQAFSLFEQAFQLALLTTHFSHKEHSGRRLFAHSIGKSSDGIESS
jgi:hypothetical protein